MKFPNLGQLKSPSEAKRKSKGHYITEDQSEYPMHKEVEEEGYLKDSVILL